MLLELFMILSSDVIDIAAELYKLQVTASVHAITVVKTMQEAGNLLDHSYKYM